MAAGRAGIPRALTLLLPLLLALAGPARADVLLPGHKPVRHELVLEASELLRGRRLVAFPVRGLHGTHAVVPGEPFRFSSKYGTRLYAVAESEPLPESPDEAWRRSHLAAVPPVSEVVSVPFFSPLESVRTRLRVRALDESAGRLELEVVAEEEVRDPRLLVLLATLALAGLGGGVLLGRRRARARRGAGSP